MVEYLLDASALYPLVLKLRDKLLDYLALMAVLDLTVYEVGNVIWEESRGGRVGSQGPGDGFRVLRGVKVVRVEDRAMADVLERLGGGNNLL